VRRFGREQLRALKKLAGAPQGVTEPLLIVAHGFSVGMLADLVLAGLATVVTDAVRIGDQTIKVDLVIITDAGRKAIEG
jgi:hypothetical protein